MGVVFLSYRDDDMRLGRCAVDRSGVAAGPFGHTIGLDLFAGIVSKKLGTWERPPTRRASRRNMLGYRLDRVDGVSSVAATTSSGVAGRSPPDGHARLALIGCGALARRRGHVA